MTLKVMAWSGAILAAIDVSAAMTFLTMQPTDEDLPGTGRIDNHGLGIELFVKMPGTEHWSTLPEGTQVESTREYKYEYGCSVGDSLSILCANNLPECTDGDDGVPVQWFWRSSLIDTTSWTRLGGIVCMYNSDPNEDVLGEIAERILSAFRSLPVDAGSLTLQPSPHTLIGANTNVYAETENQIHEIKMLGQDVVIEAIPQDYSWNYGDGTSLGPTSTPGGPLPQARWGEQTATSHVYTSTGDFNVSLTTTFSGTYSVNGGPAIPIPGTGTFSAEPVTISVWRSVVNNFADNCLENPNGAGC